VLKTLLSELDDILMTIEVVSKKRAARIERRKNKVAAIFNIEEASDMTQAEAEENGESASKKPRLSDEEYQVLRKKLKDRKRALMHIPTFRLVEIGLNASLNVPKESRIPVLPADVQSLLAYSIVGDTVSYQPFKWCKLVKWTNLSHTVVLAVDDISVEDFEANPDLFPETLRIFEDAVEMANPTSDGLTLSQSMAYVPLSIGATKRLMAGYKSVKEALKKGYIHNISDLSKPAEAENEDSEKPIEISEETAKDSDKMETVEPANEVAVIEDTPVKPKCTKTQLLLSAAQMISENYPVPGIALYKNFVLTNTEYKPVTDNSPMFSIDCEWCLCVGGAKGLSRVAVVDEQSKEVYHTFVKPKLPIVDYLTKYSGITKELLRKVRTTEDDVRRELLKILTPDCIIVGQTVSSDLVALKLIHPYIIDTAVIYNLTGHRKWKSKLSLLTETFLKRPIQTSIYGHNPIEDSIAAMELVVLKLQEGPTFGDVILSRSSDWKDSPQDIMLKAVTRELEGTAKKITEDDDATFDPDCCLHMKLFTFIQSQNKQATLVASPAIIQEYKPKLDVLKPCLIRKKPDESPAKAVAIHEASDLKNSVKTGLNHVLDQNFTVIHTSIDCESSDEAKRHKRMKKIDKHIGRLFKSISVNGMMVVVFGGSVKDSTKNGACFVRINKPVV